MLYEHCDDARLLMVQALEGVPGALFENLGFEKAIESGNLFDVTLHYTLQWIWYGPDVFDKSNSEYVRSDCSRKNKDDTVYSMYVYLKVDQSFCSGMVIQTPSTFI